MGLRRSFKPTNLVSNGDFHNGTTGWDANAAALNVDNHVCNVKGTGASSAVDLFHPNITDYSVGKKIYLRLISAVTNSSCSSVTGIFIATGMTSVILPLITNPTIDVNYPLSTVATLGAGGSGNVQVRIRQNYADAATANGKVMKVQNVICLDLTTIFGAGNEPSKAWCDLNIPNWFDGTLSSGVIGSIGGLK